MICGTFVTMNCVLKIGSVSGTSSIGNSAGGSTFASSRVHCAHAAVPQKSSTQRKPALQQVETQPLGFVLRQADRADVGRHGIGAAEERVVGEPDHPLHAAAARR